MELIGTQLATVGNDVPSWMPAADGSIPITNATLEAAYQEAITLAATLGADATLGLGWIALASPLISFNGFTEAGKKRFRIWCTPGAAATIVQLERTERYPYRVDGPQPWREDPTWEDLLRLSWAAERPFHGSVTLWPRLSPTPTDGIGLWRVEYRRVEGGVTAQPISYVIEVGQLRRDPQHSV